MWKCKNPECGRTFSALARISIERKPSFGVGHLIGSNPLDTTRVIVEKPCCPYCESIEFEEVTEKTQ